VNDHTNPRRDQLRQELGRARAPENKKAEKPAKQAC
jgi:hypothetical protein